MLGGIFLTGNAVMKKMTTDIGVYATSQALQYKLYTDRNVLITCKGSE
jgi:hypothetical protein